MQKKLKFSVLFFALNILTSIVLVAQFTPKKTFIQNLNLEDGISQCVITDIEEDKKGFIWIATFDGLNRFDGYNFKVFRNKIKDTLSLTSSKIFRIFPDLQSHLWLRTVNGFCIFNTQTGKTISKKWFEDITPFWFTLNDSSSIWIASKENGLLLVDSKSLEVRSKTTSIPFVYSEEKIIELKKIKNNIYCISSAGHIYTYNLKNNNWSTSSNPFANEFANYEDFTSDDINTFYIASGGSDLIEYNIKSKEYKISEINNKSLKLLGVNDIVFDKDNNALFISTYGQGIFVYDISVKELTQYGQHDNRLDIASNYPLCIKKDKNGVTWLGYDGRGIDVLDPNIKKFSALKKEGIDDLYSLKFVRKIIEGENGNLWFATAGSGLVCYNRNTEEFKFYNKENLFPKGDNFILEMVRVGDELWLGFNGGGIGIFNMKSKTLRKTITPGETINSLSGGTIWSYLWDKSKRKVWIGTRHNGLNVYDLNTNSIEKFDPERITAFEDNGIRCLYQTANGSIYIGTEKGLYKYYEKDNTIKKIFNSNTEGTSIESIKCIYEDVNKNLWLGTDGAGLVILDKNYKIQQQFTSDGLLKNNVVYGILPESNQSFWVSSNAGLANLVWKEPSAIYNSLPNVFHYDLSNGLQSNEYNTSSYAKLMDGSLAFGGIDGVDIFQGQEVRPNTRTPKTVITNFSIFNNKLEAEMLVPYVNSVDLKYRENSFSVNYNTLGFTIPLKTKYKYQLIGYDNEWVEAGNRTYASYTNLNPGNYEFRVVASNYDGYWSEEYSYLKIHIATPFYKTIWFYLLLALLIGLIVYLIYRNRVNQVKAKEKLKSKYAKEIAEVEMKALRAQINPHFLFNSLNSINNFILKNDNVNARKYLVKFSQLVRNILNNSSNPYISLREELDTIELYMQIESMRFDNQFNYTTNLEPSINANNIQIPSLLLQPYIENAIWHGLLHKEGSKTIEININQLKDMIIQLEIIDNGIGRDKAQELRSKSHGKSFGMQLGANRIELMKNNEGLSGDVQVIDLKNENGEAIGTKINITLPILEVTKF